jgi:hypothetical protein
MYGNVLDIFNDNAFAVTSLTDAINDLDYVPGRIGQLGLFEANGVDTTTIAIEHKRDVLTLVPPTPRGAPGTTIGAQRRTLRQLNVPHFEINDAIYADSLQGVRAFGQEKARETVAAKITERMNTHTTNLGATEEVARLGAIQGIITYQDGSTLNLFDEFGVAQVTEVNFDLSNANPVDGDLRERCTRVTRSMMDVLGNVNCKGVRALCGDNFFDALLKHKEVRETYKGWSDGQILRDSYVGADRLDVYGIFQFGGIVFENYRGAAGAATSIDTDEVHMFPTGVPGLFRTAYAPADYNETVNTMGQRFYSKQYRMPNDKGVNFDTQMNALQYCTRPKTLIKGRRA